MTNSEIETLQGDIKALKRAIRKADPFLRSVVELRCYAWLSLPLGMLILAYCALSQILLASRGSIQNLPDWWKTLSWAGLGFFLIGGSVAKFVIIDRRAAQIEEGARFSTAVKALYGGEWLNVNLPIAVCIVVMIAFSIWAGHPWYIAPTSAIFFGLACGSIAVAVEARSYLATGWYSLCTGLVSLFFIESAPFVCLAIVWGGTFLVYGVSGLAGWRARGEGESR
jgi:hypothetical protein